MNVMSKIIVIGGGPSGMAAAIKAAERNEVILVERNEKLGKKLYLTGKGRCNITSSKDISEFFDFIPGNPDFLYSALYNFTNEDTINFFESRGVKLKVERGDRVFPESDKSSDIINVLSKELYTRKVTVLLKSRVIKINTKKQKIESIELENGTIIKGDYFIIATGGLSYPETGSTGDGMKFSMYMGHSVIPPQPSLIPIEVEESWVSSLQGLSLKNVELSLVDKKNRTIYKDFGEMLFTHFGLSGPIVLTASRYAGNTKEMKAIINLKPALSFNELDQRIQKDFNKFINKDFKNSLDELLPKKLIDTTIKLSGIDENKKVNLITRDERKKLAYLLQNMTFKIKGLRPINEAIITRGGINVKEINPSDMNSKIIQNLYFAGEVIDVDGFTGGFNLQIALSTGYLAGEKIG